MKLALVSLNDSTDVGEWSGLNYHIARSLERAGATLHRVGPLRSRWTTMMRVRQRWYDTIGSVYHAVADPAALAALGEDARPRIPSDVDAVLSVSSLVAAAIGRLEVPTASWDDATQAAMLRYYPDFHRMPAISRRQVGALGLRAAKAVTLAIYASEWAAASARDAYGLPPERVAVVPFGANLERLPNTADIETAIANRPRDVCRLLWVGVDWRRKGGPLVVDIARAIKEASVEVELTIVGCEPDDRASLPPWVHVEGFISKRTADGEARLAALFARAHFFIMPSSAEAYGLVYAEAAAFGVPCVATRTGGVETIIVDDVTGILENPSSAPAAYVARLLEMFKDRHRYERMARAARGRAEERLNWDVAGNEVVRLMQGLVARRIRS